MMPMSGALKALVDEAHKRGTISGLPDRHFIAGGGRTERRSAGLRRTA